MTDEQLNKALRDIPGKIVEGLGKQLAIINNKPASTQAEKKADGWQWLVRVGGIIAILGGVAGVNLYIISSEISKSMGPIGNRLTTIETKFDGQEKRMDRIDGRALPAMLSAPLPKDEKSLTGALKERRETIENAVERGIHISDPQSVVTGGLEIIRLARANSSISGIAWQTALAFARYRSSLNSRLAFSVPGSQESVHTAIYPQLPHADGSEPQLAATWGTDNQSEAAALRRVDMADPNKDSKRLPIRLWMQNGIAVLDDFYLKKVTLTNVRVIYRGGALKMEDVVFINCTFEIEQTTNGENLGKMLIADTQIDFSTKQIG
jgi:hypothetical protein